MADTQATDVVTFGFKGNGVCCVVCGTIDYQINFFLVHNVVQRLSGPPSFTFGPLRSAEIF